MTEIASFFLAVGVAYFYAFRLGALLLSRPHLAWLVRVMAIITLFCPGLMAAEPVVLRAIGEVLCLDIFLKVVDYARLTADKREGRSFREFAYLLVPFPIFLAVLSEKKRLPRGDYSLRNLARILLGAGGVAAGFGLVLLVNTWPPLQQSFLLDHLVKVPLFLFTVESGSRMMLGIERLLGFDTTPLVRNVFFSQTVGDFWLRWNNRVHRWLGMNLFRPAAKRFGRFSGVLMVFGFSGLVHEITFDIATRHIDGYQLAFFTMQAPLVLLTEYFTRRRHPLARALVYVFTVIWMTATSMLFLRGVDRVFPFVYVSQPWLP